MKAHVDDDAGSGYIHAITGTSTNKHDVKETSKLLREDDHVMYGDSGYFGAPERPEIKGDELFSKIEFRINKHPSNQRWQIISKALIGTRRWNMTSHLSAAK